MNNYMTLVWLFWANQLITLFYKRYNILCSTRVREFDSECV